MISQLNGSRMHLLLRRLHIVARHLKFRKANLSDKYEVLHMRDNVYRGLDYLPDYYDYFLRDKNRTCVIGEFDGKVMCFGVLYIVDNGKTMLNQAGRVHEAYERRGIFRKLSEYCNNLAREQGCIRRVALVETTLNKYARSERFRKTHREISSRLHYAGIITPEVRTLVCRDRGENILRIVSERELEQYLSDDALRQNLFPSNRLLLDYVPLRAVKENLVLLRGRNIEFFSNIKLNDDYVKGLLSAGSSYQCINPPRSYTIDIFGSDEESLESHVLFHIKKAIKATREQICLQIFINKGHIAQELCRILTNYGVQKCNWYVEGGVTIKSIVEENL